MITEYIFVRTIRCSDPQCNSMIPLSPNWNLIVKNNKPVKILKLNTSKQTSKYNFSIIDNPPEEILEKNKGTISRGNATCPFCKNSIPGDYIKEEAKEGTKET